MLPFFGPSTNRDMLGRIGDNWTTPLAYADFTLGDRIAIAAVEGVDTRSQLLDLDSVLEQQLDPYVFLRTAYLQRRLNQVYDGNPPAKYLEPELPED